MMDDYNNMYWGIADVYLLWDINSFSLTIMYVCIMYLRRSSQPAENETEYKKKQYLISLKNNKYTNIPLGDIPKRRV